MDNLNNSFTPINFVGLLELADILDQADAERLANGAPQFNMHFEQHDCGAPACAWGHYAVSTPDRKAKFVKVNRYGANANYNDARIEFNLPRLDWWELFDHDGCGGAKTAKQAADYIRAYVQRKQGGAS